MALLVQRVVGELHFQEKQRLLHPVAASSGGAGVYVCPKGGLGLGLSCDLPLLLLPLQRNKRGMNGALTRVRLQDVWDLSESTKKHDILLA